MPKSLTILFAPLNGHGHVNACHGLAEELRNRGHLIVFAVDKAFKGLLTQYGFEEELVESPINGCSSDEEFWPKFVVENSNALKGNPIEVVEGFSVKATEKLLSDIKVKDDFYKEIVNRVKPDLIIVDSYICSPALTNSSIPWVWLLSASPSICLNEAHIPPAWSGFAKNGKREEWEVFREQWIEAFRPVRNDFNNWLLSKGAPELPLNVLHPMSPYLNIYIYPEELDHWPLSYNWLRVDSLIRTTNEEFTIPKELDGKPGKLVYLSMGTSGSADLEMMKRITRILSRSPNRFIVSKGPLHDKYELPDNMWGEKMLPQTKILPLVDLVITNGGNNTISETLYFGKPMIVMPLFADQLDNAQRIKEFGFGLRLDPYTCSETTLIGAVDSLVDDRLLKRKLDVVADRIRKSNGKKRAADKIESILGLRT